MIVLAPIVPKLREKSFCGGVRHKRLKRIAGLAPEKKDLVLSLAIRMTKVFAPPKK